MFGGKYRGSDRCRGNDWGGLNGFLRGKLGHGFKIWEKGFVKKIVIMGIILVIILGMI
jgi:hypothetical protein